MALRDKAQQLNAGNGIPFMEGREKGDTKELYGKTVVINDYGFIKGEDSPFLVFTIEGDENNFYFGASVITSQFQEMDAEGYGDEIRQNGIPVVFEDRLSKKGRTYQAVEFFPAGS